MAEEPKKEKVVVPTVIQLFDLGVGELDLIPLMDPIDSTMPPFDPVLHTTSESLSHPLETLREFAVLLSLLKDRRWLHAVYEVQYAEAMASIKQVADAFAEVAVCVVGVMIRMTCPKRICKLSTTWCSSPRCC